MNEDVPVFNISPVYNISEVFEPVIQWHYLIVLTIMLISPLIIFFLSKYYSRLSKPYNLSQINWVRYLIRNHFFPHFFQHITFIGFIGVISLCLFMKPSYSEIHPGRIIIWVLWWPCIMLSFLCCGRLWCSICPVIFISNKLSFKIKLHIAKPYRNYLPMICYAILTIVSFHYGLSQNPKLTGIVLLSVFVLAVIINGISKYGHLWCQSICPVLVLANVYSLFSFFKIWSKNHSTDQINQKKWPHCPAQLNPFVFVDPFSCELCLSCTDAHSATNKELGKPGFYFKLPFVNLSKELKPLMTIISPSIVIYLWSLMFVHFANTRDLWSDVLIRLRSIFSIGFFGANVVVILSAILFISIFFFIVFWIISFQRDQLTYIVCATIPILMVFHLMLIVRTFANEGNWLVYLIEKVFSMQVDVTFDIRGGISVYGFVNESTGRLLHYTLLVFGVLYSIIFIWKIPPLHFRTRIEAIIVLILYSSMIIWFIIQPYSGGG